MDQMKIPLARLTVWEKGTEAKAPVNPCPSVVELLFLGNTIHAYPVG